jgi:hypothetical protein
VTARPTRLPWRRLPGRYRSFAFEVLRTGDLVIRLFRAFDEPLTEIPLGRLSYQPALSDGRRRGERFGPDFGTAGSLPRGQTLNCRDDVASADAGRVEKLLGCTRAGHVPNSQVGQPDGDGAVPSRLFGKCSLNRRA